MQVLRLTLLALLLLLPMVRGASKHRSRLLQRTLQHTRVRWLQLDPPSERRQQRWYGSALLGLLRSTAATAIPLTLQEARKVQQLHL